MQHSLLGKYISCNDSVAPYVYNKNDTWVEGRHLHTNMPGVH